MRTVHRLAETDRWSRDAVLGVWALPWRPNRNDAEKEPAPRMNTEHAEDDCGREDGAQFAWI